MNLTAEQRTYARIAGVTFFLKHFLEGFGDYITIIGRSGDSFAEIARYAAQSEVLWRFALLCVLASWFLLGVQSFALYAVLEPVNRRIAQAALYLRLGACFVGASSMTFRFAQGWLYRAIERPEFTPEQLRALVSVIQRGAGAGIETAWMFQALGLLLFYLLFLRSRILPRALAHVGILGAALLLVASLLMYVYPTYINVLKLFGLPGLIVDLVTSVILLYKSRPSSAATEARA